MKLLPEFRIRNRSYNLIISEIITIAIHYYYSGYKTFKDYYTKYVLTNMKSAFTKIVSYN